VRRKNHCVCPSINVTYLNTLGCSAGCLNPWGVRIILLCKLYTSGGSKRAHGFTALWDYCSPAAPSDNWHNAVTRVHWIFSRDKMLQLPKTPYLTLPWTPLGSVVPQNPWPIARTACHALPTHSGSLVPPLPYTSSLHFAFRTFRRSLDFWHFFGNSS